VTKIWQKQSGNGLTRCSNEILDCGEFYISVSNTANLLGGRGDGDGIETALITLDEPRRFYILNGDHSLAYEKLVGEGFAACKAYFDAHPELKSSWSN